MKPLETIQLRGVDAYGSGAFGASRGSRTHKGVDLIASPGTYVYAPFSGKITKYGWAYANDNYRYIEITGDQYRVRLFYAELDPAHHVGKEVEEGQFLGLMQDLGKRYTGIPNHLHFEIYDLQNRLLNPTKFFEKKTYG